MRLVGALLVFLAGCARGLPVPEGVAASQGADPLAVVEAATSSLEPSLRARALALRVTHDGGEAWVARGLYDPEPYVQIAVIDALDDAEVATVLDPWVAREADPYARAAAAVRLGASASAETRASLAEDMQSAASWERAPLALAATAVGAPGGVEVLVAVIAGGQIPLEPRFVRDLGRVGHEAELRDALREGADRIEPELAPEWSAAQIALGAGGAARSLVTGGSEDETLALLDALLASDAPSAVGVLRALSRGRGMTADYARCVLVARHGGSARSLVRVAISEVDEVRALAMQCASLAEGASDTYGRIILAGIDDEAELVQRAAARAAQARPATVLMPYLHALATRDDPATQLEAAGAILAFQRRERSLSAAP